MNEKSLRILLNEYKADKISEDYVIWVLTTKNKNEN